MVGGLVQQQQVGFGHQRARQGHALDAAARQARNLCRGIESETRQHVLDTLVEAPALGRLDRVLQCIKAGHGLGAGLLGHREHRRMVFDQQLRSLTEAIGHGAEDIALEIEVGLLRHVRGHHARLAPDRAIIQHRLPRQRSQQAGLARTVAPDQGDALAGLELETHVVEQIDVPEGETGVINGQQGHGKELARSAGDD